MGLREGYKDKYYLYTIDGWKMCSVIPLAEDTFNIGNYAGMHFQKVLMTMLIQLTSCGGDRVNVREETFTVHATVEIKCDYTRELTNQMDIEEEKRNYLM